MRPVAFIVLAFMIGLMLFVRAQTMNEQAAAEAATAPVPVPAAAQ